MRKYVILCLSFCAAVHASEPPKSDSLHIGGVERHFLFLLPSSYDGSVAMPLVLIFHGFHAGTSITEHNLGFTQLQNRHYFLAVYPEGIDLEWNGGVNPPSSFKAAKSDDVIFVSALIDYFEFKYKVDPKRIFATGSSNGAIFCNTLGTRLSERIAAIGPVNGTLGRSFSTKFSPKYPISVISFNGTDDPFNPFSGDPDPINGLLSTPDTIAAWVKADRCDPNAKILTYPPSIPDDGTTVKRFTFEKGADGTEVVAFIVIHGGHTWPGSHNAPAWSKVAGKTAMSVTANEEIIAFFEKHPKQAIPD